MDQRRPRPPQPAGAATTGVIEKPDTSDRGYECPYTVQFKGAQKDRFPGRRLSILEDMLVRDNDSTPYPDEFTGIWENYPHVARLRKNLTALSQHYNLYFVAYRSYIYVYKPNHNAQKTLGDPLVILNPQQSRTPMAAFTSGHVNRQFPDEVNDMCVGELGDKEILLIARDNGDVVAWYTHIIARDVESAISKNPNGEQPTSNDRLPSSMHFFADNVGVSAWGLAIHKTSRLIAVSANTKEVTIFAFALHGEEPHTQNPSSIQSDPATQFSAGGERVELHHGRDCTLDQVKASRQKYAKLSVLQERLSSRRRRWRIIIPMGAECSNIPSVSFCEDVDGNADRIAAIDITGCLYIAEIWNVGTRPLRIPIHNVPTPQARHVAEDEHWTIQGWNVLPVTDSQLLLTDSCESAMGLATPHMVYRGATRRGAWTDISKCMVTVKHDAAHDYHEERIRSYVHHDSSRATDGPWDGDDKPATEYLHLSDALLKIHLCQTEDHDPLGSTIVPCSGDHWPEMSDPKVIVSFAGHKGANKRSEGIPRSWTLAEFRQKRGGEASVAHLLRGVSFLRANTEDIEMLSLADSQDDSGMVCHHVLAHTMPRSTSLQNVPWDMSHSKRCSMLLKIPELHMVIIGSMCGRVALLTLTRPPASQGHAFQTESPPWHPGDMSSHRQVRLRPIPRRSFRVDAVLPFEAEQTHGDRPIVCLLGIAVSPIPEVADVELDLRRREAYTYLGSSSSTATSKDGVPVTDNGAGTAADLRPAPKRWRLILHYMNHDILQYEISQRATDTMEVPYSATAWEKRAWRKEWDISRVGGHGGGRGRGSGKKSSRPGEYGKEDDSESEEQRQEQQQEQEQEQERQPGLLVNLGPDLANWVLPPWELGGFDGIQDEEDDFSIANEADELINAYMTHIQAVTQAGAGADTEEDQFEPNLQHLANINVDGSVDEGMIEQADEDVDEEINADEGTAFE